MTAGGDPAALGQLLGPFPTLVKGRRWDVLAVADQPDQTLVTYALVTGS